MTVSVAATAYGQPPSQVPQPTPFPQPPATSKPEPQQARERRDQPVPQLVPGLERWSSPIGGRTTVPPVIGDSLVFAFVPPGHVAAFRLEDGAEMWRAELTAEYPLEVGEGSLFVASGEAMHALDAKTGRLVWRQPTGALAAPPLVHEGWIVTATDREVAARRASDGTVVWQQPHAPLTLRPTIEGDMLYLPLAEPRVLAVHLLSGALQWERRLGGAPSQVTVLAGRVYVGSEDKFFYCLDAADGDTQWRHRVGAAVIGRPAIDTERVYFTSMDNMVRALDRVDGALKWQAGVPFRPSAGPVLFGAAVVVPGAVVELQTFDARTGKPGRSIALGAPLASPLELRVTDRGPIAAAVTGGLSAEWKLSVWEAAMTIPVAPLSVLPGTATPLPGASPPGPGAR